MRVRYRHARLLCSSVTTTRPPPRSGPTPFLSISSRRHGLHGDVRGGVQIAAPTRSNIRCSSQHALVLVPSWRFPLHFLSIHPRFKAHTGKSERLQPIYRVEQANYGDDNMCLTPFDDANIFLFIKKAGNLLVMAAGSWIKTCTLSASIHALSFYNYKKRAIEAVRGRSFLIHFPKLWSVRRATPWDSTYCGLGEW